MAITKTLADVRNLCVKEASITLAAGTDDTKRHDTTDANTYVNDSHRALLTLLTNRNFDFYLLETSQANLPTSRADTDEQYSVVDVPSGALAIKRVDVLSDGEWHELEKRDWTQLRSECRSTQSGATRPLVYAAKSQGAVSGAVFTVGKLALAPFSSNGKFKLSYLPTWQNITNDTHLFLYPDEFCAQWVVWDVVIKYAARDNNAKQRYAIALANKEKCEKEIGFFAPRVTATGPLTVTRSPDYNR